MPYVIAQALCLLGVLLGGGPRLLDLGLSRPPGIGLGVLALAWTAWTLWIHRPGRFAILPRPKAGAGLVRHGPYALARHPMYTAVLALALAWVLVRGAPAYALPCLATLALVLWRKSLREEEHLVATFGEAYAAYRREVRGRFLPRG